MLTGGPDDNECIETILKTVRTQNFENLYGTTRNLKELAELISSCEAFLCSDSAPLHIAVALNKKTYVIFGPTDSNTLIPKSETIIPIKANDNCELKPCCVQGKVSGCSQSKYHLQRESSRLLPQWGRKKFPTKFPRHIFIFGID